MKIELILDIPMRVINKLRRSLFPKDSFLKRIPGVIHIGANIGQEREHYASHGLNVVWVEPIPSVFEELRSNISGFANQRAFCCLLTAEHGKEYTFHISSNEGLSSSIFDLAKHREIWPDIHFTDEIHLTATTLARLIDVEQIDLRGYGALVLDTQGSELLVLRGAIPVLKRFRFIKVEVADFEAYTGCCQLVELTEFMHQHGFVLSRKDLFATTQDGSGRYYDVLYRRCRLDVIPIASMLSGHSAER
jgi:FkbM family methyltransferase